jgi:hypothetical protein
MLNNARKEWLQPLKFMVEAEGRAVAALMESVKLVV